ncbi:MAG: Ig-like domain-containing protein, partial [Gemmatimonadales bacterium]
LDGLTLSTGGRLSGTPTAAGSFPITVFVADSFGDTDSQTYILTNLIRTIALTSPSGSIPAGQAAIITATVTDQEGRPLAGIPVTFSITAGPNAGATGTTDPADGRTDANGQVRFSYLGAGGPGTDTIVATAQPAPGVTVAAPQVMTLWVEPPTVVNLERFGVQLHPTTLVVTFSQPMDAARAESRAEYRLIGPGPDHKFGTKDDHRFRILSARYNPVTNSVVLRPVRRLPLHDKFQLTVKGTAPDGLTSTLGILLDGAKTGQPGSNYVARITGKLLVPPIRHSGGKQAAAAHGHKFR